MDLKKIKEQNPGFEFTTETTKKASESVLQNALKSNLNIESYNIKYSDTVSAKKDSSDTPLHKPVGDKNWKFLKKVSTNQNTDFFEEPKASLFNESGHEMAAED